MDQSVRQSERRFLGSGAEFGEHVVYLHDTRAIRSNVTPTPNTYCGKKLFGAECGSTRENGPVADIDQSRHSAYVIIMPMGRYDQTNSLRRIDADTF
jgi:hypothetical protein